MPKPLLKCHKEDGLQCFARCKEDWDCCELLESFMVVEMRPDGKGSQQRRVYGTKFPDGKCPFYKTTREAGGTYDQLCEKYPVYKDAEDRKSVIRI